MASFSVDISVLNQQSRRMSEVSDALVAVRGAVVNLSSGMASIGLASIAPSVYALESGLARQISTTSSCSSALTQIALQFIEAESAIMGISVFMNPAYAETAETMYENLADEAQRRMATDSQIECWLAPFLGNAGSGAEGEAGWFYQTSDSDFSCGFADDEYEQFGTQDRPDLVDSADTMQSISIERTAGVSLWGANGSVEGPWGSAEGEVRFLNADAGVSAYAGFLSEDGKFAPGFGASAEASISLFEANGEVLLGNDYLGQYYKGEVQVCAVEASVSADIGLFDSEGKWNPSLGVSAEAEAILAQASGSAGYRIMGTDIGVNGSIGFGAGAHADLGFQDGVLKVDLGVYLGVGGSVGFELDFSDTYDTMVSAWDATTDFVGEAWDTATDWASEAWDTATDWAEDAWDFVTFWD